MCFVKPSTFVSNWARRNTYGLTSLTCPNFFLASSVETVGGTTTSSLGLHTLSAHTAKPSSPARPPIFPPQPPQGRNVTYIQSIGVVTPSLSPVCKLSTTLNTSLVFLPVLAGYIIVNRIFLFGSITKTERMVNAMPFWSIFVRSCASTMSYSHATCRSASAMMGNCRSVLLTSLMSRIHRSCEERSLALYGGALSASRPASYGWPLLGLGVGLWHVDVRHTSPINFTPRFSNSPFIFAKAPNSVVPVSETSKHTLQLNGRRVNTQMGVKSALAVPGSMSVCIPEVKPLLVGNPNRMREENGPFVANPLVKVNITLRRLGLEVGRRAP